MRETDVLIVGSGPAGAATALELVKINPGLANRITVLDKAEFPRKKICGGGLTPYAFQWLNHLFNNQWPPGNLEVQPVREAQIRYGNSIYAYFDDPVLQIVERKYFDHWLLEKVLESGVEVLQSKKVTNFDIRKDWVEVYTDDDIWKTALLVGADGANSFVRRHLGLHTFGSMARLLEKVTPANEGNTYHANQRAVFDFTPMSEGLQGYYWDFPTVIDGETMMNRGVFDSGVHDKNGFYSLKEQFERILQNDKNIVSTSKVEGHPIYRFHPGFKPYCYRAILVGDAAGSDPFLGEGIAFALHYGTSAAKAINEAFQQNEFSMEIYEDVLREHSVLSQLWTRYNIARLGYGINNKTLLKLIWKAAPWIMGWQSYHKPSLVPLNNKRMYRLKRSEYQLAK